MLRSNASEDVRFHVPRSIGAKSVLRQRMRRGIAGHEANGVAVLSQSMKCCERLLHRPGRPTLLWSMTPILQFSKRGEKVVDELRGENVVLADGDKLLSQPTLELAAVSIFTSINRSILWYKMSSYLILNPCKTYCQSITLIVR